MIQQKQSNCSNNWKKKRRYQLSLIETRERFFPNSLSWYTKLGGAGWTAEDTCYCVSTKTRSKIGTQGRLLSKQFLKIDPKKWYLKRGSPYEVDEHLMSNKSVKSVSIRHKNNNEKENYDSNYYFLKKTILHQTLYVGARESQSFTK